jgi:hypothetical protein
MPLPEAADRLVRHFSSMIYISFNELAAGLGIAGLVIASLLNVFLRQQQLKN